MTEQPDYMAQRGDAEQIVRKLAGDFEMMAENMRRCADAGQYQEVLTNLIPFPVHVTERAHWLLSYQDGAPSRLQQPGDAVISEEEMEKGTELLAAHLEDLLACVSEHPPKSEWYTLSFDVLRGAQVLTEVYNALALWTQEKARREPPNLNDSARFGTRIWRASDE